MSNCLPCFWRAFRHRRRPATPPPDENINAPLPPLPLKATFNRLPAELLLNIVQYLNTCPRDRRLITAICSNLRRLAISEPHLWTEIDLRQSHGVYWAQRCFERSGNLPLTLYLQWPLWILPHVRSLAWNVCQRTEILHCEVDGTQPADLPEVYTAMAPRLRTVIGQGPFLVGLPPWAPMTVWNPLMDGLGDTLSNLCLHGGLVEGFPWLPVLKKMEITSTHVSVMNLLDFLGSHAQLESILLSEIAYLEDPETAFILWSNASTLYLPQLHTLRLVTSHRFERPLLNAFPNPSTTLDIRVRQQFDPDMPRSHARFYKLNDARHSIDRFKRFWLAVSGCPTLPPGLLIARMSAPHAVRYDTVVFRASSHVNGVGGICPERPSAFLSYDGFFEQHPILRTNIDTIQIHFAAPGLLEYIFYQSDLYLDNLIPLPEAQRRLIASVDQLVISGAGDVCRWDGHAYLIRSFKAMAELRKKVKPLAVDFKFCDVRLRSMGEKLVEEGVWSEMRWNPK